MRFMASRSDVPRLSITRVDLTGVDSANSLNLNNKFFDVLFEVSPEQVQL